MDAGAALILPGLEPPPRGPAALSTVPRDPDAALGALFGFSAFRRGQREAVEAALAGRDALVVMPTGSGKSLCYQLPALLSDDLAVVVSPLVSLMQDQVEALERIAPGCVGVVNAQRDAASNRETLARAAGGALRILYVAPERFASPGFVERLRDGVPVGLFVVDEAHCVSQWGHDFRPDYFRLADAARYLGARSLFASTATATPQVARDIVRRLGLRDPVHVATGFDRPNLSFGVVRCANKESAARGIVAALREPGALPAIVYAGTRADCDRLADRLSREVGEPAIAYHAGLPREARTAAQRRFMDGDVRVVVATNAFGMGVDKADVRTVCHETVPGSIEAYYQEAGRAGRDGRPARCLLFAAGKDKGLHVFFIERSAVKDDAITGVARRIVGAADEDGRYLVPVGGLPGDDETVRAVVGHLVQAGVVRPTPSPPDVLAGRITGPWDGRALAQCRTAAAEGTRIRWRQYRAMWGWVEGTACRRAGMLRHFGDPADPQALGPCCDVCDAAAVPAAIADAMASPRGARRPARAANGAAAGARPAGGAAPLSVELDAAILEVVRAAQPEVGRTRAVEILRGGRSKVVREHSYDGLPHYGAFSHLRAEDVLGRVDELLHGGVLRSTGGRLPKLNVA